MQRSGRGHYRLGYFRLYPCLWLDHLPRSRRPPCPRHMHGFEQDIDAVLCRFQRIQNIPRPDGITTMRRMSQLIEVVADAPELTPQLAQRDAYSHPVMTGQDGLFQQGAYPKGGGLMTQKTRCTGPRSELVRRGTDRQARGAGRAGQAGDGMRHWHRNMGRGRHGMRFLSRGSTGATAPLPAASCTQRVATKHCWLRGANP